MYFTLLHSWNPGGRETCRLFTRITVPQTDTLSIILCKGSTNILHSIKRTALPKASVLCAEISRRNEEENTATASGSP